MDGSLDQFDSGGLSYLVDIRGVAPIDMVIIRWEAMVWLADP